MQPPLKPSPCRVHAFMDGQNLFHSVKRVFGYTFPNYDPLRLAEAVTALTPGRVLGKVHFYTGVPRFEHDPRWHGFWSAKIRAMKAAGINVITRVLRYHEQSVVMSDGSKQITQVGHEKGIDLRIALDLLRLARLGEFEVALLFSQDSDLTEVVEDIRLLRQELNRWIVVDCAYPYNPSSSDPGRVISGARPLRFDKVLYDTCIDPGNYFPPSPTLRLPGIR